MEYLSKLLPLSISVLLPKKVCELRLRVGCPLYLYDGTGWSFVKDDKTNYIVSSKDIDYILGVASGNSVYAVTDYIVKGFLIYQGGIRIGVVGEGVTDGKKLLSVKKYSALNIRVPYEIKGQANELIKTIYRGGKLSNVLVVSQTGAGKTTLLREIARNISNCGKNVAVIDERFEISALFDGKPRLDVGKCSDVIAGIDKRLAVEMLIRSMNPQMIITDEVYGQSEIESLLDAIRCGIKIVCSLHGENIDSFKGTIYQKLVDSVDIVVFLDKSKKAGEIKEVINKCTL